MSDRGIEDKGDEPRLEVDVRESLATLTLTLGLLPWLVGCHAAAIDPRLDARIGDWVVTYDLIVRAEVLGTRGIRC